MSDTLQEREDARHRHEQIGGEYRCSKCRAEFKTILDFDRHKCVNEHQVTKSGTCVIPGCPCRGWSAQETAGCVDDCHFGDHDEHQPAARGGDDARIRVELINGVEGQCVTVNDYRICGPKPWGGGSIAKSWTTDKNDVLRAFLTPDEKHAWLADDLQVISVKQHQSLVAERERLRGAIEVAIHNLNAGNDPKFLADYLRLTLNQKGPSA